MTAIVSLPVRVLTADPGWAFDLKKPGGRLGAPVRYTCQSVEDICATVLPPLADDALLLLWRVAAMQEEALRVVRAWGFVPKSEMVWVKLTKNRKLHFGQGYYTRAAHETCLVCTRGRFKVASRSIRSVFFAPVPTDGRGKIIHSAKPDKFYRIAERLSPGPYYELHARRRRKNWLQAGDQLPPEVAA